jgi:DNA-binding beta-propeller fold protein YncE
MGIAVLPLGQALADSNDKGGRILPIQASTIPGNGDLNPYGVAFVPEDFPSGGLIHPGDILVSNFNNSQNLQGTGTTIVKVAPNGRASLFFQGNPGLGLTTALGVLQRGFVLVGNVPTTNGMFGTIQPGSLLVLNRNGGFVTAFSNPALLDGPWDLTIQDSGGRAKVFVSNVLSGTVTRLDLDVDRDSVSLTRATQIASGYTSQANAAALVVGPTGVAYDGEHDVLYVASTGDNAIFAIENAGNIAQTRKGTGKLIYQDPTHLHGPLGLVLAPNGHLITSNGDAINADPAQPSEIVEFTKTGTFIGQFSIDSGSGGAFGIAIAPRGEEQLVLFPAVDDVTNSVTVYTLSTK